MIYVPEVVDVPKVHPEMALLVQGGKAKKFVCPTEIKKGVQHKTLFELGSSLRSHPHQYTEEEMRAILHAIAVSRLEVPENLDQCIDNIISSVMQYPSGISIEPEVTVTEEVIDTGDKEKRYTIGDNENWITCLGHKDGDYFYTTSSNPEISKIGRGSHTVGCLSDLMVYGWWEEKFKSKNGVGWNRAASLLMATCREKGLYSDRNHRGRGAWKHKGHTILHLGSDIYSLPDRKRTELGRFESSYIFTVSPSIRAPLVKNSETFKPQRLSEVCEALSWKNKSHGKLLCGWIMLARMCGALQWRPHLWLTGPKGTGKSTVIDSIIRPALGGAAEFFQGETTSAGLRQSVKCDAVPIVFDEAETSGMQSDRRIRGVIEYARQCSSANENVVAKGSVSGISQQFKPANMMCLSSIRVNLVEEQDKSRFCEIELGKPNGNDWDALKKEIAFIDGNFGYELWSYVVRHWEKVEFFIEVLRKMIVSHEEFGGDNRLADQYAPLIAGWWLCKNGTREFGCDLIEAFDMGQIKEMEEPDSTECWDFLTQLDVRVEGKNKTIQECIDELGVDERQALGVYGIYVESDGTIYVSVTNPQLNKRLSDSKWSSSYARSLVRMEGCVKKKKRFGGHPRWFVGIPPQKDEI